MLNRVAIATAAVLCRSPGLSTLAKRPALHHPQPRGDRHSDGKSGVVISCRKSFGVSVYEGAVYRQDCA
jgi:hypothetical protein